MGAQETKVAGTEREGREAGAGQGGWRDVTLTFDLQL